MTDVDSRAVRGRVAAVVRARRGRLIAACALLAGHQTCEALVPVAIGLALDHAVATGSWTGLVLSIAGFVVLFVVLNLCFRWFARTAEGAAIDEAHALRVRGIRHVLGLPRLGTARGDVVSIVTGDVDAHSRWLVWLPGLCGAVAALTVCSAVLLGTDVRMGSVLLVAAVLVSAALLALAPVIARRAEMQQETLARTLRLGADLTAGAETVQGLRAADAADARFVATSRTARDAAVRAGRAAAVQGGLTTVGSAAVVLVALAYAGNLWTTGEIGVGTLVAVVGVAQFITEPLTALGRYVQACTVSWASSRRLTRLLGGSPQPEDDGAVARLEVQPGEVVGVVGHGPLPGEVRLAGGGRVHVEPEQPYLFDGSIAWNLLLGRDGIVGPRDRAAVEAAAAAEFVDELPRGFEDPVASYGASFSGGQRQRLAVARALATDAELVVLTNPTSAVDAVTEVDIARGIRRFREQHAPSALALVTTSIPLLELADRVVYLDADGGRHEGDHLGLLTGHPGYRERVGR